MLKIKDKKIVFAGKLKKMTRPEALKIARKLGAVAFDSLDASTNILVAGARVESKVKEAVIDERAWIRPRAKQTQLSLWGWGIDVEFAKLTKRKAQQIMRKGISDNELYDLIQSLINGPTYCSLTADGEVVREITAEPDSKPFKVGRKNSYFLVRAEDEKGEWGNLLIDGDFDERNLFVNMETNDINGVAWTTFWIDYDGKDFEYSWDVTGKAVEFYIINPDGQKEVIEVIDE